VVNGRHGLRVYIYRSLYVKPTNSGKTTATTAAALSANSTSTSTKVEGKEKDKKNFTGNFNEVWTKSLNKRYYFSRIF
jgi:hypothetical protein